MDRETFLDLIPAYALGALDDAERVEFEALLANDVEAQTLLAEYQIVTDNLVLTTPARPAPARLQADMRQRLTATKTPPSLPVRSVRNKRRFWLVAAALLAVVFGVSVGVLQFLSGTSTTEEITSEALYQDIASLENVVRVAVSPAEDFMEIVGDLVVDTERNRAVFQVTNLPHIEYDQTFQLWLRDSEGTVFDGGLFTGDPYGTTYVTLPLQVPFTDYAGFGVSLEPAGGSPLGNQRSGPSVFRIPLGDA